ncbi:MAG: DMT family transporter [Pseudomonadota bacterium]
MSTPPAAAASAWSRLAPAVFVVLWSTGFIGAKLGLPYAEPFTFLFVRFVIAATLLALLARIGGAVWPATWRAVGHAAVAGILVHAIYLGGVFWAIGHGLGAGISAVIIGVQPLLTAAAAGIVLGETVAPRQWLGLGLGFAGIVLVASDRSTAGYGDVAAIGATVIALFGITAGTLYQKKFATRMDLRAGSAVQFAISAVLVGAVAWMSEDMRIDWTGEFLFALGWLVLVLSLGAIAILYFLIRHGAAAKVASLFYLVPAITALMAFFLFDERLGVPAFLGMAAVLAGVAMANRP